MQCLLHYYTKMLPLLIEILIVKSVASMICTDSYASNGFHSLLYGLGYGTLAQICPPDNFFFSYICCDEAYFECCIKFELWFMHNTGDDNVYFDLVVLFLLPLRRHSFCETENSNVINVFQLMKKSILFIIPIRS
uniref:Phospholipase A(2) n=1 Tax=Elaeophora elaphi TaxID=1147741 RepID=A0A0R3S1J2_9BILA